MQWKPVADGLGLDFCKQSFWHYAASLGVFLLPRLMMSPWEFVNRHRRWNCHISLAPLFWLSSVITQCGFSNAQGNHKFSTHYTYPLHLLYCAPYSKWHLIVRENICSYVSSFRPYKTYCHLQSKWHRAVYIIKHWSFWISGYHHCTRLSSNGIKLLFSTFLKNINV